MNRLHFQSTRDHWPAFKAARIWSWASFHKTRHLSQETKVRHPVKHGLGCGSGKPCTTANSPARACDIFESLFRSSGDGFAHVAVSYLRYLHIRYGLWAARGNGDRFRAGLAGDVGEPPLVYDWRVSRSASIARCFLLAGIETTPRLGSSESRRGEPSGSFHLGGGRDDRRIGHGLDQGSRRTATKAIGTNLARWCGFLP